MAVRKLKESQLNSQIQNDFFNFVKELNYDFSSRGLEISGSNVKGSKNNFMIYIYDESNKDEIATIAIDYSDITRYWTLTFDFDPAWDKTLEYNVHFDQAAKDIRKLYPEFAAAIDIIGDCLDDNSGFTESTTRKTRCKRVTESADGMPEPEIVKDRGAKIYNETIKILDRFGSKYASASMYAYALKEKKLADKTLYQLAKDTYDASNKLETYGMDRRFHYE